MLKVGPQSAGADPGPACYDRGGSEPTLTDALVVLGHLNPTALLEGAMPISQRTRRTRPSRHAWRSRLGFTPVEAAWGILTVLATNVTMAMRTITIERGYDPREFTLIAFGGMGPTIAGRFIGELGIGRILVPRDPGTFSAPSACWSPTCIRPRSLTRITRLDAAKPAELEKTFASWSRPHLAELLQEKFARERLTTLRSAGMRYRGQSYEVSVPVAALQSDADIAALAQTLPRSAPAPLRPHGAIRGSRNRQLSGHCGRTNSQTAIPRTSPAREPRPAPHETRTAYFSPSRSDRCPGFSPPSAHARQP